MWSALKVNEDFELCALGDGESAEVLNDRGDVFVGAGVSEEVGCRILDVLCVIEGVP